MKQELLKVIQEEQDEYILVSVFEFYKKLKNKKAIPKERPDDLDLYMIELIERNQDKEYFSLDKFEKELKDE